MTARSASAVSPVTQGPGWQPVRADVLRTMTRLRDSAAGLAVTAAAAAGLAWTAWSGLALAADLIVWGWLWATAGRRARAWTYAEQPGNMLIRHGVLIRTEFILPYARLQFAEVSSGPISRRLGVATLRIYTAASTSRARIRGLDIDRAEDLRARLVELAAARGSGS